MVAAPAGISCGTVNVAVSVFSSSVTCAVCVPPPDSMRTSPNSISAACSVIAVAGSLSCTWMVSRPRKVSFCRSGANQSV